MKVSLLFKGVTYQTLVDPKFITLVNKKIPGLDLMEEHEAARGDVPDASQLGSERKQ